MSYLRLEAITKRFGDFVANDDISLSVAAGSIHALLGENGAGKSTLMNVLSGLYQPDAGQIYLEDQPIQISSPSVAAHYGIGMIHQHFMLVPRLTVTENIILGADRDLRLNLPAKAAAIEQMGREYGLEVPPFAKVEDLAVGIQQRVEILKVLYRRAKILILDEPTAVLTPTEIASFLQILRQLAANQHTIIFITHKLDEVMAACDAVTVLRRGKVVASLPTHATSRQALAQMMVDRQVVVNQRPPARPRGEVRLAVENLWVKTDRGVPAVRGVSFQLHAGEILGVAGVDGNGQRQLADAIAGLSPIAEGKIQRLGENQQIGYIPEDRQKQGLVLSFSIARNLILKAFRSLPFCRRFFLQADRINRYAEGAIQTFDIRATSPKLKASQLSGGNQQKVILARELDGSPALIIAMQPTRGLDIGATEAVQQALLTQRAQGAAILYISTELEEVMAISDRIAVIYAGEILDILDGKTATLSQIGLLMAGGAEKQEILQ
ncbi:ABC transporter ATP-binding protein [Phormidium tenue FACHB-886]|nr:ABC transporter ATP-binding protein [Phormidium tenue FACHB-886]